MSTATEAPSRSEQVAADQQAMTEAREQAAHAEGQFDATDSSTSDEDAKSELDVREEGNGQLAISSPGTQPKYSTDTGGYPPTSAELVLKSTKAPWDEDLRRGSQLLLLVWGYVDEVRVASKKVFQADVLRFIEFSETELSPGDAIQAVHDLRERTHYDRAVIDQAAALAQEIVDEDSATTGEELAEAIRTQLYERHHIEDDAHEVTHGIEVSAPEPEADAHEPNFDGALV